MHTTFIKKLAVDAAGRTVLTVSDDRTARLWDARTGRTLHVFRVPLDAAYEGMLYAAALTPDGRTAFVGGFTGLDVGNRGAIVYMFDTATGRLTNRLKDLPPFSVENLEFSADGRVLAVCLADGGGLLLIDWRAARLLRRDDEPKDKILGAHFAPNGDFAMTTLDGRLWVYRASDAYATRQTAELGDQHPMHVRFSPNGQQLAIGMDLSPAIRIYSAATLEPTSEVALSPSASQRGLHVVDWTADGRHLIAGGEPSSRADSPVYLWDPSVPQQPTVIYRTQGRIGDLKRLADGAFAFVSSAPEVGVLETQGQPRWRQVGQTMNLRLADRERFRASSDGTRVTLTAVDGARSATYLFDVMAAPDQAFSRTDAGVAPAGQCARGHDTWRIAVSADGERFTVNDRAVHLDPRERARDWCISPDGSQLLLGSAWSIRAIDRSGAIRWRSSASADVVVTNATADGRYGIVALDDGTIRWYRMNDGAEVLAFLPHRNGTDWVAWIPSGYYMSSVNGDNLIGWHLNNGLDQTPDFYRAIQFERILYRPDVVREYFRSMGETDVRTILADIGAFRIDDLRRLAPPKLEIRHLTVQAAATVPTARFTLTGSSKSLPLQDYTVFVNDIPVTPWSDRALSQSDALEFQRNLEVPLTSKDNRIRVEAFNGQSMGVLEAAAELPQAPRLPPRGDLYLVAIGVNRFANFGSEDTRIPDLRFAAQDADEVARYFETAATDGEFRRVHTFLASDNATELPTRDVVKRLVTAVRDAGPQDTVIVFLASHGWSDPQGKYYFFPADTQPEDIDRLAAGRSDVKTLIDWQFFFDEMRRAAGRRVLIVDTCNSANMRGTLDVHALAKRSAASRFALMAASKGDELSQEYASGGHGIFTFGLLQALRNGADSDGDGETTLREAFTHAYEVVQTTRPNKTRPQTPQLEAPTALQTVIVASDSRSSGSPPGPSGVHVQ